MEASIRLIFRQPFYLLTDTKMCQRNADKGKAAAEIGYEMLSVIGASKDDDFISGRQHMFHLALNFLRPIAPFSHSLQGFLVSSDDLIRVHQVVFRG